MDALDFPIWNGKSRRPSHVPAQQWLAYCRSNLPLLRSKPGYRERRRLDGIPVEFVL